jgi:hypothetical protein
VNVLLTLRQISGKTHDEIKFTAQAKKIYRGATRKIVDMSLANSFSSRDGISISQFDATVVDPRSERATAAGIRNSSR